MSKNKKIRSTDPQKNLAERATQTFFLGLMTTLLNYTRAVSTVEL